MDSAPLPLKFDTNFDSQTGQAVTVGDGLVRITAPNPGPYTFTGTNTFLLGSSSVAVVDPGPDENSHFAALTQAIGGRKVDAILLTHTHKDHTALARRLKAATGAPLWFGGKHRRSRSLRRFEIDPVGRESDWELEPDRVLVDGEAFTAGRVELEAIATPGHCANHLCFHLRKNSELLSGDHVMGWNSTLVPVPDGSMVDYLRSLEKLVARSFSRLHPAHGGPVDRPGEYIGALLTHRKFRNQQIIDAVDNGARTMAQLVRAIYPTLALALQGAARMTLTAHIEYLEGRGGIRVQRGVFGTRVFPA
jgi:glyoxylase-like metal-dependent hydrolase (beta-lactamase superfamily II)